MTESIDHYCFYCGEPATFRDDETRAWWCDSIECNRELSLAHEEMRQREHEEVDLRWSL